jgi:peptidoglycan/LPS O-acetylase OafA/YrhL
VSVAVTSRHTRALASARVVDRSRADIQAIRGLAVLLVVLHHSGLVGALKAGYLGVDVFFVVSGYLITGMVQRGLQDGSFSFTEFYFRRAKRLLPAAYVVFVVTALLAPLFLTQSEILNFRWQMAGAASFTGNIVLWLQMGYFEDAALLKPLLHVWSLSIEEQYYLFLPLALVITPRRYWGSGALAIFIGSLGLCLALVAAKPSASFYLLPTRAWELALGSVGPLVLSRTKPRAVMAYFFWPALLVLALLPFFPIGTPHPGLDSLAICVATLVLLVRQHPAFDSMIALAPMAALGDISYSLYLVHWPVFAFAENAWVSSAPALARLGLLASVMLMAWALYRYVELPIRRIPIPASRSNIALVMAATLIVGISGFAVAALQTHGVDYTAAHRVNRGLGDCESGASYQSTPACQNAQIPEILLWGDSFAMHLANGIVATTDKGLAQATKSVCGPFVHLSGFDDKSMYNRRWAEDCIAFNDSVLRYVSSTPSIEVVVLAGTFSVSRPDAKVLVGKPEAVRVQAIDHPDIALSSMRATIDAIRAMGKRVVIVAPPPTSTFDIGRCLELRDNGRPILGADEPSCKISRAQYRTANASVLSFLERIKKEAKTNVIRFDDLLCGVDTCSVELEGVPLYRDSGHFSIEGGILVARKLKLGARILAEAQ